MRLLDRHPSSWLLVGASLIALANVRFPIGLLGWVAWVPFLRFLHLRSGPRPALLTLTALVIGWTLATAKICTAPLPLAMAPRPPRAVHRAPLLASAALHRRLAHPLAGLRFPAAMVVGEWAQHALTPFGSWGAAAYTQLDALPLLQVASVAGLAGPSFLVYLGNAALADALDRGPTGLGAALCHDADFPRLGLALAGQGLDLLALPSSDWLLLVSGLAVAGAAVGTRARKAG